MKALVVDDDEFQLKLISSILEKNSYEVELASSGKAALAFLDKGEHVDVIISDVMMPHMDGFSLLRALKFDRRLTRIPVIFCTSLGDKSSIVKGIQAGITDYLIKPIKESSLLPKLQRATEAAYRVVLVVDDEEILTALLKKALMREHYRVLTAGSGKEALELLTDNEVAVVLSDICMPGMDGFELLAEIKEINTKIPVLLMSGRGQYTENDAVSAGADGFIPKPFHNTQIVALVQAHWQ